MPRTKTPRRVRISESTPLVEREFSTKQRKKMAGKGQAMPSGGFPIASEQDLRNAIQAIGRASDPAAAKAHIIKRAKALNLTKLLPDGWLDSVSEADRSLMDQYDAVRSAIIAKYRPMDGLVPHDAMEPMCWVRDVFDDYAIVEKGTELYRINYTIAADGSVELAEPVRVEIAYQPVSEATDPERPAAAPPAADPPPGGAPVEITEAATLLEAKSAKGSAWRVLLVKAGLSANRRHYSESVLKAAIPLFEGTQAYADHPTKSEQRERPERSSRDVVGWYENVAWDAGLNGLVADFNIVESAEWLMKTLKSAWDKGKTDLLGFSINAEGDIKRQTDGSVLIEAFTRVFSTDVVTKPGAGGGLLGVLESERGSESESDMNEEQIRKLIQEAMAAGLTGLQSQLTETLKAMLAEQATAARTAVADPPAAGGAGGAGGTTAQAVTEAQPPADAAATALREAQDVLAEIKRQNRRGEISARIDAAKLPTAHAGKLKARLLEAAGRRDVEDAEVDAEIQYVRDLIAESGPARPNWSGGQVEMGDSEADQMKNALMGWFQGEKVSDVEPVRDLKESYCRWTRQSFYDVAPVDMFRAFMGGYDSEVQHKRISESLTQADWAQVFGDVFYLQMIRAYQAAPEYNQWRKFVSEVEGPSDFRTRHWAAIGGYADLATVAELGTYPELTSPGDEEQTYSLAKRGGIDSISMEMVLGDRLQQVRRMPQLMAYAASRGLYKFVLDMITTDNPTLVYDSTALYAAGHGNTGTTAFSVSGLDAVNIAMRDQTARLNTSDILASRNKPRYVIVPNELESLAQRVLKPSDSYLAQVSNAGTDVTFDPARWQNQNVDYHVYDYLTDTNNWWVVADPAMMETMVVGFLNGRQDPELFTQDQANVGGVFSSDRISYKVRFIYGGAILDHRAFYRQVV